MRIIKKEILYQDYLYKTVTPNTIQDVISTVDTILLMTILHYSDLQTLRMNNSLFPQAKIFYQSNPL